MYRALAVTTALTGLASGCSGGSPEVPSGYTLVQSELDLPSIYSWQRGDVQSHVRRFTHSPDERRLLSIAENLYPDPDVVAATVKRHSAQLGEAVTDVAPPVSSDGIPRWWIGEKNGELLPFAVTAAALDYYLGEMEGFWQRRRGSGPNHPPRPSQRFDYSAHVSSLESSFGMGGAYVVQLRMSRSVECDPYLGDRWVLERRVVLTSDGEVLEVQGDGMPFGGLNPTSCEREDVSPSR